MYNNDYMYAIERSDEYLAHYGVLGMKWGVRRALKSGNSARLARQYAKAQKKMAKLEKQASRTKKYAKRAALMGIGAAAAGGLAAAGTHGVGNAINAVGKYGSKALKGVGTAAAKAGLDVSKAGRYLHSKGISKAGLAISKAGMSAAQAAPGANLGALRVGEGLKRWGNSTSIGKAAGGKIEDAWHKYRTEMIKTGDVNKYLSVGRQADKAHGLSRNVSKISNNTIARVGAGAIGAGLAVGAAHNAYKAATAKKRAAKFRSEMNKAFAGTKYDRKRRR